MSPYAELEAAKVDLVFCAGPLMRALWDVLPAGRRGGWAVEADDLAPALVESVRPGDVVMVKGSLGSRASVLAAALAALASTTAKMAPEARG